MGKSLIPMIRSILLELEATNLSCIALKRHKSYLNSVITYCSEHGYKPIYSKKIIQGFLNEIKDSYEKGEILYGLLKVRRKAAYLIIVDPIVKTT